MKGSASFLFLIVGILGSLCIPHFGFSFAFFYLSILLASFSLLLFLCISKERNYVALSLFSCFVALSFVYASLFIFERRGEKERLFQKERNVSFLARIDEYPLVREKGISYVLSPLSPEKIEISPHTRILFKGLPGDLYSYGNIVEVKGILKKPFEKDKENGSSPFSYRKFLQKDSIFFVIEYGSLSFYDEGDKSLQRYLYELRDYFKKPIEKHVRKDEGGLTLGVLLGEKHAMSTETEDLFSYVGLSHIIVLSGYNISLLVDFSLRAFSFFGVAASSFFTGGFILLFVLMVGGGATAWRAFLMTVILLFARKTGNLYSSLQALLWAAVCMSFLNPYMAAFDPSFHLSFLATLGILLFFQDFSDFFLRFFPHRFIAEMLATTYAATLLVFPYLLFWMQKISLLSLVSNVFILPLVPVLMFSGALFMVSSLIIPSAAPFLFFIVFLPAKLILLLAELFGTFPGGEIETSISVWEMIFLYSSIFCFYFYKKQKRNSF